LRVVVAAAFKGHRQGSGDTEGRDEDVPAGVLRIDLAVEINCEAVVGIDYIGAMSFPFASSALGK